MQNKAVGLYLPAVVIALLLGFAVGFLPYYYNQWVLTTPDAGGLACGAQTLADTGHFSDGQTAGLGYNFNVCWTNEFYPALQWFTAGLIKLTGLAGWQVVPLLSLSLLTLCTLAMAWAGYALTRNQTAALLAATFTPLTPILLRAHILTPQNLIGYLFIILLIAALAELTRNKRWWWWLVIVVIAGVLAATHTLSFGVAGLTCAVWFVVCYLPNWWWRGGALLLSAVGIGLLFLLPESSQFNAKHILDLLSSSNLSGYDHPLYDHPALWGYVFTALAAFGFVFPVTKDWRLSGLIVAWIVGPLLLGHLSIFGWQLLPDRFVAYSWIGIVLAAASGAVVLWQRLQLSKWIFGSLVAICIGAQLLHTIVYIQDDIYGWSDRFKPHDNYITALQWLDTQPNKGILVGIMAAANREITFAPVWYQGPVASYPWYNLDHKDIKSFAANSSLYKAVFENPESTEYLRVKGFYSMIAKPNSVEAKAAADRYSLNYLILPLNSQAGKIWLNAKPKQFPQIYQNETYAIYQLQ